MLRNSRWNFRVCPLLEIEFDDIIRINEKTFICRKGKVYGGKNDAAQARWFPIDSIPPLAFDHDKILRMALEKIKKGMI